ncbi:redoxin domain-containing protein [Parapedobacter sp. 2B3]|uniref:TlpA family protein disulfide reductase n=1 Tax=Parapedobacter sp. 2B3 TaxID=3342381 RepID=UPI0035B5C838
MNNFRSIYLICLLLFYFLTGKTQENRNQENISYQEIAIGKPSPDFMLDNVINFHKSQVNLSDFKGKRVLLDFWTTSCIPCIQGIPKMEALQKEFNDELQIILVGITRNDDIVKFYNKRIEQDKRISLPIAIDSTVHKLFNVKTVPHYVWIDDFGVIQAVTYSSDVTKENIRNFVNGVNLNLTKKNDIRIDYNPLQPLLIDGNGNNDATIIHSTVLTGYIEGLRIGQTTYIPDGTKPMKRIKGLNTSSVTLYRMAYADENGTIPISRTILELENLDKYSHSPHLNILDWAKQNAYCYELNVSDNSTGNIFKIMRRDLENAIGLEASFDIRNVDCYVMSCHDSTKLNAQGDSTFADWSSAGISIKNKPFSSFFDMVKYYHQDKILLDETGINKNVDIQLNTNMTNLEEINNALFQYGITIEKCNRKIKMLVLKD